MRAQTTPTDCVLIQLLYTCQQELMFLIFFSMHPSIVHVSFFSLSLSLYPISFHLYIYLSTYLVHTISYFHHLYFIFLPKNKYYKCMRIVNWQSSVVIHFFLSVLFSVFAFYVIAVRRRLFPTHHRGAALRRSDGTFVFNGNWAINWSGEYQAAGTTFNYRRQDASTPELISTQGPLTEPIDIMVRELSVYSHDRRKSGVFSNAITIILMFFCLSVWSTVAFYTGDLSANQSWNQIRIHATFGSSKQSRSKSKFATYTFAVWFGQSIREFTSPATKRWSFFFSSSSWPT